MSAGQYTVVLTDLQIGAIRCALRTEFRMWRALALRRPGKESNVDLLAMADDAESALRVIEAAKRVQA